MNYYPFHLGDYAAHTAHLEPVEDLAYRRMLDAYYLREAPLPADPAEVARLVRLRGHLDEVQAVLREFFDLTPAGWAHARCDEEIEKMQDKQAKAKASAAASVNARKAKAERTLNEGPATAEPTLGDRSTDVERALNERSTNAQRTLSVRSTDVELPTPTPTPIPKESSEPTSVAEEVTGLGAGEIARTPRALRKVPAGFTVDDPMRAWAFEHAPLVNVAVETAKFCDHTFARAISDWKGAWRNWLRRSQEDAEAKARPGRAGAGAGETAFQRTQRETVEALAPGVARRSAGFAPLDFLDDLNNGGGDVPAIESR